MPKIVRRPRFDTAPDPSKLYVVSALRRDKGRYRFVIRWLLGASDDPAHQANDLPRHKDVFEVTVRKLTGDYLQADGRQWDPKPYSFHKSAMPLAMIDPPRAEAVMPGQDPVTGKKWLVSQKPTAPVDPAVPNDSLRTQDGSLPMGVIHLLEHSDRTVVAHKIARIFADSIMVRDRNKGAEESFANLARGLQLDFAVSVDLAALQLSEFVMVGRPRPWQVVDLVAKYIDDLSAEIAVARSSPDAPEFEKRWYLSAMLAAATTDRVALDRAVALADEAERVRSQLRLRSLQGGKMLDFWAGGADQHPNDADRGRQWSASDLFGLGIDVGDFSEAEIGQLLALPNGSRDGVHIEVHHVPAIDPLTPTPSPSSARATSHPAQRHLYAQAVTDYGTGECRLTPADIEAAIHNGSSCPPMAPLEAFVNYDLVRKWLDPDKAAGMDSAPLAYGTGDGRVEILIRQPQATAEDSTTNNVMGFNVYAVWEGASPDTDQWFRGHEPRCIEELKPWLVTRRFSLLRDLAGALLPSGGSTHPNLDVELNDPAWHPAMVRASAIEDRTSSAPVPPDDRKLPNVILPGLTIWSLDLRRGMGTGAQAVVRGWDPGAPAVTAWTPYYWRYDDPSRPSKRTTPQRYRFWVTSVDGLDQESDPVSVRTADAANGETETHLFVPRNRTPLPFPAQDKDGSPKAITITTDSNRQTISVGFSVPDGFHLGGQEADGPTTPPIDPTTLQAKVMLLRRRLVKRVDPRSFHLAQSSDDDVIISSPAWQKALKVLQDEGWIRVDAKDGVPKADGRCDVAFPLQHFDRGFEYRAVLGFAIAASLMPFWYPLVSSRIVHATKKVNGKFEAADPEAIVEAPAIGGVGQTTVLPLPNRAPPRDATLPRDATSGPGLVRWAKPVLPPPGVDRDRVLMRLLSNPVAPNDPSLRAAPPGLADWLGEGLNLAQAHMAHSAMLRVAFETGEKPTDEQWAIIRDWVAHDLKTPSTGLRQHGLVGFRGLMALEWNYVPIAKMHPAPPADPAADSDAEATLFRIYTARAPRVTHVSTRPDLEVTIQHATGTTCSFATVTLAAEVAALLKSGLQPVLVAVRAGGVLAFGHATGFSGPNADQLDSFELAPFAAGGTLSPMAGATCQLYFAVPAVDIKNTHFGQESDAIRCYVPVGGGPEEVMAWWVAAVSAQEVLSQAINWPTYFASFPATTQVSAPTAPIVRSVVTSKEPWLDDSDPAWWRPQKLTNATAPFEARIFAMWTHEDFPAGSYVEVDRVSQPLGNAAQVTSLTDEYDEWNAIKTIEATADGKALDPTSIQLVAKKWLLGLPVEPDPTSPPPSEPYVSLKTRPLQASDGLRMVEPHPAVRGDIDGLGNAEHPRAESVDDGENVGGTDEGEEDEEDVVATTRPALIDYFAADGKSLMESDTEYKYRIRVVQDIAPDAPDDWRYLRSEWSTFSPFVVPVRPQLVVTKAAPVASPIGLRPPAVEFHVETDEKSGKATYYRVTIQRKVRAALLGTPENDPDGAIAWRDVGSIIELVPGSVDGAVLRDDELERLDVFEPLAIEYRIRIMHYAKTEEAEQRILRKAPDDLIKLIIPAPASTSLQEQMLIQKVTLE